MEQSFVSTPMGVLWFQKWRINAAKYRLLTAKHNNFTEFFRPAHNNYTQKY